MTRDHLLFYVNGERRLVRGEAVFLTLSEYLRDELRLVGTKVVCAEGDCGACSVLVGRPAADRLEYLPIDACITFLHQLDASHLVTVEGLARDGQLHPVQQAMVDGYGSQCGFCTPGIVMALAGHFEARAESCRHAPDPAEPLPGPSSPERWPESLSGPLSELRQALTGNLCRCTGYWQILESAAALDGIAVPRLAERYPEETMLAELCAAERDAVRITAPTREVLVAADLDAACRFKAGHPECGVIAGATDVAVRRNKGAAEPVSVLALGRRMPGFADAIIDGDVLRAGAGATWSRLLDLVAERVPELAKVLARFGAPQIRNAATLGGNLANASPIADSLPFLYVAGAVLELRGPTGTRRVPIESFYRGYKQLDLQPGELIAAVEIPLPGRGDELRLYKMSRRRALDIASFTAAVLVRRAGAAAGVGAGVPAAADAGRGASGWQGDRDTITSARLAYGGVGPTVLRLPRAEAFLAGRPFTLETFRRAGEIAASETTPWTDVRGSDRYRRRLAENALVKFFHEVADPDAGACEPLLLDRPASAPTAPEPHRLARESQG